MKKILIIVLVLYSTYGFCNADVEYALKNNNDGTYSLLVKTVNVSAGLNVSTAPGNSLNAFRFTIKVPVGSNVSVGSTNSSNALFTSISPFFNTGNGYDYYVFFKNMGSAQVSLPINGAEVELLIFSFTDNTPFNRTVNTRGNAIVPELWSSQLDPPTLNNNLIENSWQALAEGTNGSNNYIDNFTILPIKLSSFTAEKSGDRDALLKWQSIQETNSEYFVIQRSDDGLAFFDIGKIDAAGNNNSPLNYTYLDRNINLQRNSSKLVYYRLKQVDRDGFTEFSNIRALRFERLGISDISIYPNPTADVLHLDFSEDIEEDQISYLIFDVEGKLVGRQDINIGHQKLHLLNLKESGLTSGIYFIKLRNQKELLSSHKFVIISQ